MNRIIIAVIFAASHIGSFPIPPSITGSEFADPSFKKFTKGPATTSKFPTIVSQQNLVNSLIAKIDGDAIKAHLIRLTQFPERYYKSNNGVAAADWLSAQVDLLQPLVGTGVHLSVRQYIHKGWKQPSVIARLEATSNNGGDLIIVGTHFDTLGNGVNHPEPNNNPGADDCASGSSVLAETLRVLVKEKFVPLRPIEFHWYAAEEEGMLGSDEIAEDYANRKVTVFTYLNLDQSGYVKKGTAPTLGIMTDFVSKAATAFIRQTIKAYTRIGKGTDTSCGYACSDHASWTKHGYNSAIIAEATFSNSFPYSDQVASDGSALDTVDNIDFEHVTEFVRNTIGFAVELSLAE